jgi:rubrerythrin
MAKKNFKDLTEREILALAVQIEEEDSRIYGDFADGLREMYPSTAKIFEEMQAEERKHSQMLLDMYQKRFGDHLQLVRPQDVRGFVERKPVWLVRPLGIKTVRKQASILELETRHFYERALSRITDAPTRKLLSDLVEIERQHSALAETLEEKHLTGEARNEEEKSQRRLWMLQVVQPGLAGLIDGSVSTLAPIFAAAFATQHSHAAFLVGLAASLGAGVSMAFTEALSDDGSLTGRGKPLFRGIVTGAMTAAGGLGHTLPFLISSFHAAIIVAVLVVAIELAVISFVRHRYMDMPLLSSTTHVVLGGIIVLIIGIWIGSS